MLKNHEFSAPILISDLGRKYPTNTSKQKKRYCLYRCFCGNTFEAQYHHVKNGRSLSCGCLRKKIITKHNLSGTKSYCAWHGMMRRCYKKDDKGYSRYGAKGVVVCERWHDFINFYNDMGAPTDNNLSIDRIDPYGNYEPSNCRWATKTTQSRNTRILQTNNKTGYRGVSYCKKHKKYRSSICINSKTKTIGLFDTAIEAAEAYDRYVIENNFEHTINGCTLETKIKPTQL